MLKSNGSDVEKLLIQATCKLLVNGVTEGTAWLVSKEGYLLTAGHLVPGEEDKSSTIKVCFPSDCPRTVGIEKRVHVSGIGLDYAILLLEGPLPEPMPEPLPVSYEEPVTHTEFQTYGYGKTLKELSPGRGKFAGIYLFLSNESFPGLALESTQLGEGGYSGAPIYSNQLNGVVGIQIMATKEEGINLKGTHGETVIAMPMSRIKERVWEAGHAATKNEEYLLFLERVVIEELSNSIHERAKREMEAFKGKFIDICVKERDEAVMPLVYVGRRIKSDKRRDFRDFWEAYEYEDYENRILLLGEPGSGKTTALLNLTRRLVERALEERNSRIPILLRLRDWDAPSGGEHSPTVRDWAIKQVLNLKFEKEQIKESVKESIIDDNVVLLLDGLDEVEENIRPKLINSLNDFLRFSSTPVIICSRTSEYKNLNQTIHLTGAVELQPLNRHQIEKYLIANNAIHLRDVLLKGSDFYELAQTPLTLSMMALIWRHKEIHPILTESSRTLTEKRKLLFDSYVKYVMRRHERHKKQDSSYRELITCDVDETEDIRTEYTQKQVNRYLGWLAIRLIDKSKGDFTLKGIFKLLEEAPDKASWNTATLTNAATMGLIGIIMGLSWFTTEGTSSQPFWIMVFLVTLSGLNLAIHNFLIVKVIRNWKRTMFKRIVQLFYFFSMYIIGNAVIDAIHNNNIFFLINPRIPITTIISITLSGFINAQNEARGSVKGAGLLGASFGLLIASMFEITHMPIEWQFFWGIACGFFSGQLVIWLTGGKYTTFFEEKLLNNISRLLLALQRKIPLNFEKFHRYVIEIGLLKRVPAMQKFDFIHPLIMAHFALIAIEPMSEDQNVKTRLLAIERLTRLGEPAIEVLGKMQNANAEVKEVRKATRKALKQIKAITKRQSQ